MCQSMSDMQSCSSHWKLPSSLQWGTMLALALVACMPIMHAVAGLSAAELTTECSGHAYHHAPAFERGGWMAAGQPGSHQHQVSSRRLRQEVTHRVVVVKTTRELKDVLEEGSDTSNQLTHIEIQAHLDLTESGSGVRALYGSTLGTITSWKNIRSIRGNCPDGAPLPTMPASEAPLRPLLPNQCVLTTDYDVLEVMGATILWLDALYIRATGVQWVPYNTLIKVSPEDVSTSTGGLWMSNVTLQGFLIVVPCHSLRNQGTGEGEFGSRKGGLVLGDTDSHFRAVRLYAEDCTFAGFDTHAAMLLAPTSQSSLLRCEFADNTIFPQASELGERDPDNDFGLPSSDDTTLAQVAGVLVLDATEAITDTYTAEVRLEQCAFNDNAPTSLPAVLAADTDVLDLVAPEEIINIRVYSDLETSLVTCMDIFFEDKIDDSEQLVERSFPCSYGLDQAGDNFPSRDVIQDLLDVWEIAPRTEAGADSYTWDWSWSNPGVIALAAVGAALFVGACACCIRYERRRDLRRRDGQKAVQSDRPFAYSIDIKAPPCIAQGPGGPMPVPGNNSDGGYQHGAGPMHVATGGTTNTHTRSSSNTMTSTDRSAGGPCELQNTPSAAGAVPPPVPVPTAEAVGGLHWAHALNAPAPGPGFANSNPVFENTPRHNPPSPGAAARPPPPHAGGGAAMGASMHRVLSPAVQGVMQTAVPAETDTFDLPHTAVPPLPPPTRSSPLDNKMDFLHQQLDSLRGAAADVLGGLELLGSRDRLQGGQAIVQMARCKRSGVEYAAKFFVASGAFDAESAMYGRGAHSAYSAQHAPALAQFLPQLRNVEPNTDGRHVDTCGHPLPPCIVMERGESLDIWAARAQPDRLQAFTMIHQLAMRLKELHAAGYVHRDLKPGNVMWLPRENRWTVIDFGCAAETGKPARLAFSLACAAPEVITACRSGQHSIIVQEALDAWSLGVMAFELLTGEPALRMIHGKDQVMDCIQGVRGQGLPWGEERLVPGMRRQLGIFTGAVLQLLARDTAKRPSMAEFCDSCDRVLAGTTTVHL